MIRIAEPDEKNYNGGRDMTHAQTIPNYDFHENRKYKDSLFRLIFNEKESLLELYNGLNRTNYSDIKDWTISSIYYIL